MKLKIVFILLTVLAFADSGFCGKRATDIQIDANFKNNELYIKIFNRVTKNRDKFIRRVDIAIDEKPVITKPFLFQSVGYFKDFTIDIEGLIEVKKIKISAYRHKGGILEKEFDIQTLFKEEIAEIMADKMEREAESP